MTKQEYLIILQEKLESFSRELQREIIEDYEEHFAEGLAAGKTEEEIVEELGDIEDMIRELPEEEVNKLPGEEVNNKKLSGTCITPLEAPEVQTTDMVYRYSCQERKYRAVVIDGFVADVTLEKSEDENIYVRYENDAEEEPHKYRFYQYERDGILYLEVKENEGFRGRGSVRDRNIVLFGKIHVRFNSIDYDESVRLSVKVPDGFPRIELRTVSGDAVISRIIAEKLSIGTASGDLKLLRSKAQQIKVKTASGDFEIVETACKRLGINTASGDVSADAVTAEEMSVKTGSGDVKLGTVKLDNLVASTGSGDIAEAGEARNRTISAGSGDIVVNPRGEAESVRINTGSGDVILDMRAINGVRATVQTGSGDGTIQTGDGRHYVSRGECTVGEGPCRVMVQTGSGDAVVKM